jgi:hypothetical protein
MKRPFMTDGGLEGIRNWNIPNLNRICLAYFFFLAQRNTVKHKKYVFN